MQSLFNRLSLKKHRRELRKNPTVAERKLWQSLRGQHSLEENQNYDIELSSFFETKGIKVLRFWNNEVMKNFEGVWERIAEVLSITGTPPTPS